MIEVFKTSVTERWQANILVEQIHQHFMHYKANFDLHDCDRILRVKSASGYVHPLPLIRLLEDHGFHAEVLPDNSSHGETTLKPGAILTEAVKH